MGKPESDKRDGGACHTYTRTEWNRLLDDMAGHGMNSLALVIKQNTTGYRSALPWLDQNPACPMIASNNALLRHVIGEPRRRGLRVWLAAVCSHHQVREFGITPPSGKADGTDGTFYYDPDYPGVSERMVVLFREIADLFPSADGLVVEMESVEFDWPHRVPLYNAWAAKRGLPSLGDLRLLPLDARAYRIHAWREYLTHRRCEVLRQIEQAVRETGFGGKLAMILETGNEEGAYTAAVPPRQYAAAMPGWAAVTYDDWRNANRWATRDFCMEQPRAQGLETYYLGRGVMTYSRDKLTIPLERNWELDVEDALASGVEGLWFFGADAHAQKNQHSWIGDLRSMGFNDGRAARLRLLKLAQARCRQALRPC